MFEPCPRGLEFVNHPGDDSILLAEERGELVNLTRASIVCLDHGEDELGCGGRLWALLQVQRPFEGLQRLGQHTGDVDDERVTVVIPREGQGRVRMLRVIAVKGGAEELEHLADLIRPVARVNARVLHHSSLDDGPPVKGLYPYIGEVGQMDVV